MQGTHSCARAPLSAHPVGCLAAHDRAYPECLLRCTSQKGTSTKAGVFVLSVQQQIARYALIAVSKRVAPYAAPERLPKAVAQASTAEILPIQCTHRHAISSPASSPGITLSSKVSCIVSQGSYASLGICRSPADWRNMAVFLGIVGTLLGVNYGYKAMGTRTSSTKRKKALAELEKDE